MHPNTSRTERFFVDAVGFDREGLEICFKWAIAYARDHSLSEVAIAVATKRQIENLNEILGESTTKALLRNGHANVGAITFRRLLKGDLKYLTYREGPVLAIWPGGFIDKIDPIGAPAICAIPWSEGNLDAWKENWGPIDLRHHEKAEELRISNPVVEVALEHLSVTVNLGTGLSHPSDRGSAIGMFKMLRDAGEFYDPSEVRAWATRNGWEPEDARELADIAQKILDRRALRGGERWSSDAIPRLRAEATERTSDT